MDKRFIRNFCIIAHIDHGKSTLADRLLELTGAVDKRYFREQMLDDMDLERERGITIKAKATRLYYRAKDNNRYILNLIDTPGHVDFSSEVIKSLVACEGAILLVDASQGVEAQTVANFYLAKERNLMIIPVINKIDLPNADLERCKDQLLNIFKFNPEQIFFISAKEGRGVSDILEEIIKTIPPPKGNDSLPLQAFVFDSTYDTYKGIILYVRIMNGVISKKSQIYLLHAHKDSHVEEIGVFEGLNMIPKDYLYAGEVGYVVLHLRDPRVVFIGDTLTDKLHPSSSLQSYRPLKPLVFSGLYPVNPKDFNLLREAMEKLRLNDASFVFEPEESVSFGNGFRCGFLGLLHMEIIQERLEREYNLDLILTTPNVVYRVLKKDGSYIEVDNPIKLPSPQEIVRTEEPYIRAYMVIPPEALESVCELSKERRGKHEKIEYLSQDRLRLVYSFPLAEVIVDFYDRLKSITRGFGSLDYEYIGYLPTQLLKLDILLNGKMCEAFSFLLHKEKVESKARMLVKRLKGLIPRQLFEIRIQAAVGSKIIASEKIPALGKYVTGKCYGGDITRKRKLWEKQKMGKKRLKQFGKVQIPQEAFLAILKI